MLIKTVAFCWLKPLQNVDLAGQRLAALAP